MRLRHVAGSFEKVNDHERVMMQPEQYKGHWSEVFGNSNPIRLEIGMGKGDFIIGHAKREPNVNYIGIEKYSAVLWRALEKIDDDEQAPENLRFLRYDATLLTDIFESGEVEGIYLNFSDPWPKDRWAKRRLTHERFLQRYEAILEKGGFVEFKTDNQELFEFSVESFEASVFDVTDITRDLHQSPYVEGNIMTEYEKKFVGKGHPIGYLRAQLS